MTRHVTAKLAQLYNFIEPNLRRAARNKTPMSAFDVAEIPEVCKLGHNMNVIRMMLNSLVRQNFIIASGPKVLRRYVWNLDAPPCLFAQKQERRAQRRPSAPEVIRANGATMTSLMEVVKRIETQMGGIVSSMQRDPVTGRMSITILDNS